MFHIEFKLKVNVLDVDGWSQTNMTSTLIWSPCQFVCDLVAATKALVGFFLKSLQELVTKVVDEV
jgi:hypothetical protein